MSAPKQVDELRHSMRLLNQDLTVFSRLIRTAQLSTNDLLGLFSLMTGGNKDIQKVIALIQMYITLVTTARFLTKMLYIEMGPMGWAMLAGTTAAAIGASYMMEARRPRY